MAKRQSLASLTPEDVIRAAYFHYVMKLDQHEVATILNVNQGRVAEACVGIMYAAVNFRDMYNKARTDKEEIEKEHKDLFLLTSEGNPPNE